MRPRKLIDITFTDLFFGLCKGVSGLKKSTPCEIDLDGILNPLGINEKPESLICYSVRTGFDLLLQSLRLPPGSEVLMTAATIPDMIEIVRRHQLVPRSIDMKSDDFQICPESFEQAVTPKTKLVVVAHLFGSRANLDWICNHPLRKQFLIVEDCAQLFIRDYFERPTATDVQLFSFGPIKTATALGGGVICCKDKVVNQDLRRLNNSYPQQSELDYLQRIMKYFCLKSLAFRPLFSVFYALPGDPDKRLGSMARNFGQQELLDKIRKRPCRALVNMVRRRIRLYPSKRIEDRRRLGGSLARQIRQPKATPGVNCPDHSYWLFPVLTKDGDQLVVELRHAGFDATRRHSMTLLESGEDHKPADLKILFEQMVLVPFGPELGERGVRKLANVISGALQKPAV